MNDHASTRRSPRRRRRWSLAAAALAAVVVTPLAISADNAIWTWIQVGWIGHQDTTPTFFPGDEYVDWIGYDPFNYYVCRDNEWRSPDVAFSRWYYWLQRN